MGAKIGSLKFFISPEEVEGFVKQTHFDTGEVELLFEHFSNISATEIDDCLINLKEFQMALGLKESFFVERFFALFDTNKDGFINFSEFIIGLSILSSRSSQDEKIMFSFKIYDLAGDGKISREGMNKMLEASSIENDLDLTETHMDILIDRTFEEADRNKDGFIDFGEYKLLVRDNPSVLRNLTLNISQRIREERKRLQAKQVAAAQTAVIAAADAELAEA